MHITAWTTGAHVNIQRLEKATGQISHHFSQVRCWLGDHLENIVHGRHYLRPFLHFHSSIQTSDEKTSNVIYLVTCFKTMEFSDSGLLLMPQSLRFGVILPYRSSNVQFVFLRAILRKKLLLRSRLASEFTCRARQKRKKILRRRVHKSHSYLDSVTTKWRTLTSPSNSRFVSSCSR